MRSECDQIITDLQRRHPAWQFWVIHRVVGGPLWCTRRRDDHSHVLNADDPDDLAVLIGDEG